MHKFPGFPRGSLKCTPLPNLFFNDVVPEITSLAELKVTLHAFMLIQQKKGLPRFVTERELLGDSTLLRGLKSDAASAEDALREGLADAVARGTLLHLTAELGGSVRELFLLNSAQGRESVAKLRSGELEIGQVVIDEREAITTPVEQSNIFTLYEQNVGLLTPLLAEELGEAEKLYPPSWIEDAFKQALMYNRRSWQYIRRILERWAVEGRGDEDGRSGARRIGDRPAQYGRWRSSPRK